MIRAVLFDRDGTLIVDNPKAGSAVTLMPLAREAVGRLRRRGVRIGVVYRISPTPRRGILDVRVHARDRTAGSARSTAGSSAPMRRPRAAHAANRNPVWCSRRARAFDVPAGECAVIGDIGSDVQAARSAGARGRAGSNSSNAPRRKSLRRKRFARTCSEPCSNISYETCSPGAPR